MALKDTLKNLVTKQDRLGDAARAKAARMKLIADKAKEAATPKET